MSDHIADVAAQIDRAYVLAEDGHHEAAAQAFALARTMSVSLCDRAALNRVERGHLAVLGKEREEYRSIIAGRRSGERTLVVLADSLGLPRPDEKSGDTHGADRTYPMAIMQHLPEHAVDSICQRYFTTDHVRDIVQSEPELGADGADVVVHVGLNDCANRMFLERERLSLNLLDDETKERIVGFAQKYRRHLIRSLPSCHYVPPSRFKSNLDVIASTLRARGARRVVFATIILPPIRFWAGTPGVQRNFGNYNQMIMDAAAEHGELLLDIDRHVWARQEEGVLLPDGMHLSDAGHELFASELAALLA